MAKILENKKQGPIEYTFAIFFNIIFFYIVNNLENWVNWLSDGWTAVLWIINISIVLTIVFNLFYIFYDKNWFKNFTQIILNVIGCVSIATFYILFPLNLDATSFAWSQNLIKILLIIGFIGTIIAIIVNIAKLFYYLTFPRVKN